MSNKETIVALKSDEQASLSPGAYEVLTAAVAQGDPTHKWTFEARCELAEKCLPVSGFRAQVERLHADMLAEVATLRTQLAHWKVFAEHAEGERSRLKHNEAVMMDALYKACGDDEEMVRQTIESQGVLRCDPALLVSGGA